MARIRKELPQHLDVAHLISAAVLAKVCPRSLIDEVLADTGKASQRERLLPAAAVVYYVMALSLWRQAPLEEVLRIVCEAQHWMGRSTQAQPGQLQLPNKGSISKARTRLGAQVMEQLAQQVLRPVAPPALPGAWYRGLRVMAIDGSCLDVADEQSNAQYFGYPSGGRGASAFPQMRVLCLLECGTHVVTAAQLGAFKDSEQAMARKLLPAQLNPDMLVLADRNFYGFKLWNLACQSGAKLLWRLRSDLKLAPEQCLPDGSWLSTIYDSKDRRRAHGQRVRVVEYVVNQADGGGQERYRLLTNVLEPEQAPAQELAALYHERWEIEGALGEIKTGLRGASTVLRSKTPELVKQEMWGLLLAHFAVRQLMSEAACSCARDPDDLSFMHAVRVLKRKMPQAAAIPP
jgi:hypothetical protein